MEDIAENCLLCETKQPGISMPTSCERVRSAISARLDEQSHDLPFLSDVLDTCMWAS